MDDTELIYRLINLTGTAAFTIAGYMVGFRKRLDILGVLIVALLTAIGGGILRDMMVGRLPVVFQQNMVLVIALCTLALSWLLNLQRQRRRILLIWFIIADAIGLAAFSITGAKVGLSLDLNCFGVITLAFITAVGGGILRDILVNEIPLILRRDIYGSVAIFMGFILFLLEQYDFINPFSLNILFISGVMGRLLAYYYHIALPGFQRPSKSS
ncbi:trimeric intracellular cation channel family protein [Neisseriaceae bacterium ESL0693]|nr:trimeric intracellular cation channel family protein [Neisseriaceae bacterium ESL0693]